jgi:hypothetical protein
MLPVDFVQRNQGLWSPSPLTNGSKSFQDCGAIVTSSQVKSLPDPIKGSVKKKIVFKDSYTLFKLFFVFTPHRSRINIDGTIL